MHAGASRNWFAFEPTHRSEPKSFPSREARVYYSVSVFPVITLLVSSSFASNTTCVCVCVRELGHRSWTLSFGCLDFGSERYCGDARGMKLGMVSPSIPPPRYTTRLFAAAHGTIKFPFSSSWLEFVVDAGQMHKENQ